MYLNHLIMFFIYFFKAFIIYISKINFIFLLLIPHSLQSIIYLIYNNITIYSIFKSFTRINYLRYYSIFLYFNSLFLSSKIRICSGIGFFINNFSNYFIL